MSAPKVLSLFSGAGGLDLGLEAAGMDVVAFCEIEPKAQSILRRHWPDIPVYSDVKDVTREQLDHDGVPHPDIVAGGSPCQDLSVAGRRGGLDGSRSGLFWEQCRIADEYEADILWENVVGALSSNNGADFAAVLWGITGALVELPNGKKWAKSGFIVGPKRTAIWRVLDAQHFGVPQRRRRVYVVGCSGAVARRLAPLLLEFQGSEWDYSASSTSWSGTPRAAEDGTDTGSGNRTFVKVIRPSSNQHPEVWREESTAPTLNVFDNGADTRATILSLARMQAFGQYVDDGTFSALKARDYKDATDLVVMPAESPTVIPVQDGQRTNKGQNGMGIGSAGDPSYTIDCTGSQSVAYETVCAADMRACAVSEDVTHTLQAHHKSYSVCTVPHVVGALMATDGGVDENKANAGHLIAETIVENKAFEPMSMGDENWVERSVKNTLRAGESRSSHAIVVDPVLAPTITASNNPSRSPQSSEVTQQVESVLAASSVVRRLTPLECERLMGWDDFHTLLDDSGKTLADSHRYRICGNGVVSNVTEWIGVRYRASL